MALLRFAFLAAILAILGILVVAEADPEPYRYGYGGGYGGYRAGGFAYGGLNL